MLRWAALVAVLGAVLFGDRDSLVSASLVLVGVLAVIEGSGVVEAICTGPPAGGWGFDYEWRRNQVFFGPGGFTCDGEPDRPVWLGGLFLTAGGVVGLRRGWSWPTDREALGRALPSTDILRSLDRRRALVSLTVAVPLSAFYLLGRGTIWGTLSWVPLAVLAVGGLAALVAERRSALASALVAALGLAVLRRAPTINCHQLDELTTQASDLSFRPGALAVRYVWTGTTDVPFGWSTGGIACHTDFFVPLVFLGVSLVAAGILLALRERA